MRVSTTHPCLHLLHIYLQKCHQETEKCPHKTSLSAYYVLFIRWNVLVVIGHQTKEKNCLSDSILLVIKVFLYSGSGTVFMCFIKQ